MLLKINLAHKTDSNSTFEIHIRPAENKIAHKWMQKLKETLLANLQIEKNFCWVGFPDNPRQLSYLCEQLNTNIEIINQFSASGGWKNKNYHIDDVFSVNAVVAGGDVNHDLMNSIHHHFEILQGQVWNISSWFLSANDKVRFAIRQLNNLCHEIEILIKSQKMQKENPERVSPATIVSFINAARFELESADYEHFTLDRGFGKVFMHYCQTGKTHWETFVDGDKDIDRDNISGLRYFSSEFNIEWGPNYDDTMSWWSDKKQQFKNWLSENNYDPNDKKLSQGWLLIGQVDIEKIFKDVGSNKLSDVHRVLSDYLDISQITIVDGTDIISQNYPLVKNNDYLMKEQLNQLRESYSTFCEKQLPENFCIAPFISMRQNAYGNMSPCAFGAGEWKIGHMPVKDRFFSPEWSNLRRQFLAGEKANECFRCWNEENIGKKSMRQILLETHKDSLDLITTGKWENGPVTTVWKTSNVCNLACKTCGGEESSTYKAESDYLIKEFGITNSRYNVQSKPLHVPIEDAEQYVQFSENLRFAEFYGGEPLLNKTHVHFLRRLIEKNKSKDIEIYYSTNATQFPSEELIEIWSHFKALKIGLSIDGTHKGFTYMRWPGDFSIVENNIQKYMTVVKSFLAKNGCLFYINGTMTTSNLNIFNTEDAYGWLVQNVDPYCYISLVQEPKHQAAYNLPLAVREKVKIRLESSKYKNEFQSLIQFMNSQPFDSKLWNYFVTHTDRQDRFRKLKMSESFPEFWDIIQPYYEAELQKDLI